eukprot:4823622-Amphidinium_carterae.2
MDAGVIANGTHVVGGSQYKNLIFPSSASFKARIVAMSPILKLSEGGSNPACASIIAHELIQTNNTPIPKSAKELLKIHEIRVVAPEENEWLGD